MKKYMFYLTICFVGLFIASCEKNEQLTAEQPVSYENISFVYNATTYIAKCQVGQDTMIVMDDTEAGRLLKRLNELPELVTFAHGDGTIELFDNEEAFSSKFSHDSEGKGTQEMERSAAYPGYGRLTIFEHAYFGGQSFTFDFSGGTYNSSVSVLEVPDLRYLRNSYGQAVNFNDMISSYRVTASGPAYFVILYEDPNYRGKSLAIEMVASTYGVDDIKKFKWGGFSFGKNWEDKATSLKIHHHWRGQTGWTWAG